MPGKPRPRDVDLLYMVRIPSCAVLRFLASKGRDENQKGDTVPTVQEVSQKVQRILAESFSTNLLPDGGFRVEAGSTAVFVSCETWGAAEESVLVRLRAPVLFEVPVTDELCRWIAVEGNLRHFGTLMLMVEEGEKSGTLGMDHTLLGDFLDKDELGYAVAHMGGSADFLDDDLQKRFGGKRYEDA